LEVAKHGAKQKGIIMRASNNNHEKRFNLQRGDNCRPFLFLKNKKGRENSRPVVLER